MDKSILAVFESECAKLDVGPKLAKKISAYRLGFAHKNKEHVEFFGGNLLGVQVVRFTDEDRDRWFNEVLEADESPLEDRLSALPEVDLEQRKIASDTMNLSCVYLLHVLYHSSHLSKEAKHQAMIDVALVLQYKFITSLLFHYFKYPAERSVAEATYAQLSYKFAIKQYGSWAAVLQARSEDLISDKGIHHRAIDRMDVDTEVGYLLSDTQGRIRDMIKNIYREFDLVHKQGIRITSTSSVVEHDGESILKDKSSSSLNYGRYINSVVSDKNSFIRPELFDIITKLMHTMPPRLLMESLEWMSNNYRHSGADVIEEVLNETIIHGIEYYAENRGQLRNTTDLPALLSRLRGVYMSSRSTDPALLSLREKTEKLVTKATGNKNTSIVAAVRTGLLLYVVLRTFTMHHYS